MLKVLEGPRFKLARANARLVELGEQIDAFKARHPQDVTMYIDAEHRRQVICVRIYETIPPMWGVITGEFVHNLRSALDHLVYALPLVEGGKRPAKPDLPVFETEDPKRSSEDRIRDRVGDVVPEAIRIIKAAQPFNRPDDPKSHPLAILHDLWNWDKHNAIPVVEGWLAPIQSSWSKENGVLTTAVPGPIYDGMALATCTLDAEPDAELIGRVTIEIEATFGGAVAAGTLFLPTLSEIFTALNHQIVLPLERVILEADRAT